MNKNIKLILLAILVLVLIIVFGKKMKGPMLDKGTPSTNVGSQNKKVENNFVKCDIDGQKINFVMKAVNYFPTMQTTTFLASEENAGADSYLSTIQLSWPDKTVGTYQDNETSSEIGIHYGSSLTESYQSSYEKGPTTIEITKYSGNEIEGKFKGTGVFVSTKPNDLTPKKVFDCSFSSQLEVKAL